MLPLSLSVLTALVSGCFQERPKVDLCTVYRDRRHIETLKRKCVEEWNSNLNKFYCGVKYNTGRTIKHLRAKKIEAKKGYMLKGMNEKVNALLSSLVLGSVPRCKLQD